jgi:hypothetical protein
LPPSRRSLAGDGLSDFARAGFGAWDEDFENRESIFLNIKSDCST